MTFMILCRACLHPELSLLLNYFSSSKFFSLSSSFSAARPALLHFRITQRHPQFGHEDRPSGQGHGPEGIGQSKIHRVYVEDVFCYIRLYWRKKCISILTDFLTCFHCNILGGKMLFNLFCVLETNK